MSNFALIFASGIGSRMRSAVGPKQFMTVKDKPILAYVLERFDQHDQIDGIYIVVRKSREKHTEQLVAKFGIKKVKMIVTDEDDSNLTAHASILNGILLMKENGVSDNDLVLVHDGVRPIIDDKTISKCIEIAEKYGNAITCMPAAETVAHRHDKVDIQIGTVTKRENMLILQAPQVFRFKDAYEVNLRAEREGLIGSVVDQAELNRYYGHDVHTVEGLKGNVKITVPLDFTYFEFLVESGKYEQIIKGEVV